MFRILIVAGFVAAPVAALAANVEISSKIDSVIVYPDGASIQRRIHAPLSAGVSTLVIRGLPAGIDPASLRVSAEAEVGITILAIDTRPVPGEARPSVDPALETRIETLRQQSTETEALIEAQEMLKDTIRRYAQASPEKLSADARPLDPERWAAVWQTVGGSFEAANAKLIALRRRSAALQADILALEQARPATAAPGAPKRDVFIALDSPTATPATLLLTYQVGDAGWRASYDARLVTGGDRPQLELARRASVQQRTGEDWSDVVLTLSTVRLRRATAAPDPRSLVLALAEIPVVDVLEAQPKRTAAAPVPVAPAPEGAFRNRQARDEAARVTAVEAGAVVDAGAYQASFAVPGRADVPADGTAKSFRLAARTAEPTLAVRVVPELDPTGYLEASFTQEDETPLLPGETMLFRDGALIGRGRIGLVATGDTLRLGFGADDKVKVTRVALKRREGDAGLFGAYRTDTQDYKIAVRNLHGFPVRIAVIDRLPISENTDIRVEALPTNTQATEKSIDDKRGVLGWSYDYKPGESRDIRLGWRIRWPADRDLRRL